MNTVDEDEHVMLDFSLRRRTASSSMDQSCSMLHASLIPQEMCISMKAWRGTSSACVQTGLCSACRWNITTWVARLRITRVEKLTRRLNWNLLLHLPTIYHHWGHTTNLHYVEQPIGHSSLLTHNNTSAVHLTYSVFLILCAKQGLRYWSLPLGQRY